MHFQIKRMRNECAWNSFIIGFSLTWIIALKLSVKKGICKIDDLTYFNLLESKLQYIFI